MRCANLSDYLNFQRCLSYQFSTINLKNPTSFRKLSVDPLLCAKRNSRYARSFVLTARSFDLFALRGFSLVVRPSTTIKEKLPLLISRGERLGSKGHSQSLHYL